MVKSATDAADRPEAHRTQVEEHWRTFPQRWANLSSPTRPHDEDVRRFEACAREALTSERPSVLLGVTPELAGMAWPDGSRFIAVDHSIPVIRGLWRDDRPRVPAIAVAGKWQRLPFPDGMTDFIIGDGCTAVVHPLDVHQAVTHEQARVLRPGERLVLRFFASPAVREPVDTVFEDLHAGRIRAFDTFKWRLLMATPADAHHYVRVGDAYDIWDKARIDRDVLASRTGLPRPRIDTIDSYRNNDTYLGFAPLPEALDRFAEHFEVVAHFTQNYELADRCPIVVLVRKD